MSIERALGIVLFVIVIIWLLHLSVVHAEERHEHWRGHEYHGWPSEVLPYFVPFGPPTPYHYYEPAQRCWYDRWGHYECRYFQR